MKNVTEINPTMLLKRFCGSVAAVRRGFPRVLEYAWPSVAAVRRGVVAMMLAAGCACGAEAAVNYSVKPDGIVVRPVNDAAKTVRIQLFGDKILRVTSSPVDSVVDTESLCVVAHPDLENAAKMSVTEVGGEVWVSTSEVTARVDESGRVRFFDKDNRLLLSEKRGGRRYQPISVEGCNAWSCTQAFDDPDPNEGLYGLGQHQSDEFNYKRRSEQLFQYNTKVSVPFIVSTGNYGVLWDSYSLCRFGNSNDYSQLDEVFVLRDAEGVPGALTGTYRSSKGDSIVRREPQIYFEHLMRNDLDHVVNLPRDFDFNGSEVAYEGTIEAPETGDYDLALYYSGYITVGVGDEEVVAERWRTSWNPNLYKFTVTLEKNVATPIKIKWIPNGSVAYCGLRAYPLRSDKNCMTWWSEMADNIDYYFIYGSDMDDVISGYRTLTGKAPIMPRWVAGYWQSREKYNTSDELLTALSEYRRRGIGVDNMVIDWLHWPQDSWGCHEFDKRRFPDPKAMVDSIHAQKARVMVSVWPKFYASTEHYREFDSHGWIYRQAITDSIRDWVGPGYLGSFYDAYSPEARKLFWQQIEDHYVGLGIDAWWMDASEPNIRDCTDIDYRKALCGPTALGPSTKYFNAYALVNADAIYNGQRGFDPDRRVFLLTRSGFAGLQRYSTATWSGDIATRWEDMKAQISAGLNFSASGIPWWSMDVGGFCVEDRYVKAAKAAAPDGRQLADLDEWAELNARWHQFGAFAPIYRAHGQYPKREVWEVAPEGSEAYRAVLESNRLRYRLLPYIYSIAAAVYFDDYSIMRPLVMDFSEDRVVRSLSTQYMFGPAFMVCPVTEYGARSREVYLPAGCKWFDYHTNTCYDGGATIQAEAPLARMPLFVRAGSIVVSGGDIQSTAEMPEAELFVDVYPGADGEFTLYDDDGLTYAYERGEYATVKFRYDDRTRTLHVAPMQGSFEGCPAVRRLTLRLATEPESATVVDYDGTAVSVTF